MLSSVPVHGAVTPDFSNTILAIFVDNSVFTTMQIVLLSCFLNKFRSSIKLRLYCVVLILSLLLTEDVKNSPNRLHDTTHACILQR